MRQKYTDATVWTMIADTMEMVGGMPRYASGRKAEGLCGVLVMMFLDNLISGPQMHRLVLQLYKTYRRNRTKNSHFWKRGVVEPRIEACRKLAKKYK